MRGSIQFEWVKIWVRIGVVKMDTISKNVDKKGIG